MITTSLQKVQNVLGYTVENQLKGAYNNLNDFPDEIISQIKKMPHPFLAEVLTEFYVTKPSHKFIKLFVEEVIFGNIQASTWLKGRVLVPDFSLTDQLTKNPVELLIPIGGDFKEVIKPLWADWKSGASIPGAPVKIEIDANYLSQKPLYSTSLSLIETISIINPIVSVRRWIAQRLARYLLSLSALSIEKLDLINQNLPDKNLWSADAIAAYSGIQKELQELKYEKEDLPGFCGPDEWYL